MHCSTIIQVSLLFLLFNLNFCPALLPAQKYAPVVGRWRIELSLNGKNQALEFETDGQGSGGYGTGFFDFSTGASPALGYPAAWSNRDPQKISITGEVRLPGEPKAQTGTLLLRTTLVPGQEIQGEAMFIDETQIVRKGSFTMKQLLGPEQIKEKKR